MRRFLRTYTGSLVAFGLAVTVFFGLIDVLAIGSSACMLAIADPMGVAIPLSLANVAFQCGLAITVLGIATYLVAGRRRAYRR